MLLVLLLINFFSTSKSQSVGFLFCPHFHYKTNILFSFTINNKNKGKLLFLFLINVRIYFLN